MPTRLSATGNLAAIFPSDPTAAALGSGLVTSTPTDPCGSAGPGMLRDLRRKSGLSQHALATASGLSVRTIRNMEAGLALRPRQHSVQSLTHALGLIDGARRQFLTAWGVPHDRHTVPVDEMIAAEAADASVWSWVRSARERCAITYAKTVAEIGPCRHILRENSEKVVTADRSSVEGVPLVVSYEAEPAVVVQVRALEDCTVEQTHRLTDSALVADLRFGRRLEPGDSHSYRFEVTYEYGPPTSTVPDLNDEFLGCVNMLGFHRAARLCIAKVIFQPDDPPRLCRQVFEERLDSGVQQIGDIDISPVGTAQVCIVEPTAGWHGIAWSW